VQLTPRSVLDLIDDRFEEDIEETKRRNQEMYFEQKQAELDAEFRAYSAWKS
jgi:hypothetical protein